MWKYFNGATLKLLGIIGVIGLTLLMLILLNFVIIKLFDSRPDDLVKAFITLFTLFIGGSAGAKYVSTLTVTKKEPTDDDPE